MRATTFSVVAYDTASGTCGVAISSRMPAVGSLCVFAEAGRGAIATQAWINPLLGVDGLELLSAHSAESTLRELLAKDPEPELRQIAIVDRGGHASAYTGTQTHPWNGHRLGSGYVVAGNILLGEATLTAMAEAFEAATGSPLQERLLVALEAGQVAGGDARGKQSAALYVSKGEPYPYLDLRVDDHPTPVTELRRIYEVARRELLPFVEALPTWSNPRGRFGELLDTSTDGDDS